MLILDEADRLAEEGFMKDLRDILEVLPKQRRTGLFSATLDTLDSEKLKTFGLRNPAVIRLKKEKKSNQNLKNNNLKDFVVPEKLENQYILFNSRLMKINFLFRFIRLSLIHI